ncbi:uncharacterized protein [Clytia hemisphaerica]|uniref:uncharacterized protein n=1 Tax=Clytia hemisphaerica TaxID=252671 RepID=UPI0034D593AC
MKLNEKCMEIVNQVINAGKCHHLAKYNCLDLVDERTINEVVLPVLLFWDPIEQPCRTLLCPLCHQDGNQNVPLRRPDNPLEGWENCSSNSMMPRTIWDINWYMGLVGRRYRCNNSHSVTSYHAGILRQLNPVTEVPFYLSHDSGLTVEAFDLVNRLVDHGNSFSATQKIYTEGVFDKYYRKSVLISDCSDKAAEEVIKSPPSEQFLRGCFLHQYNTYKDIYDRKMNEIDCEFLSCDHTFKVATNIGFLDENKRWIKLVDSIFLFLNENGQVLGYKLCKGTAFEQVSDIFGNLAARCQNIKYIYLDNCCMWKSKLAEYFPSAIVKLDLFHAVQRLTKTISKRHPFCKDLCNQLTLVFRDKNDTGEERTMPTPNPTQIIENMERFIKNWNTVSYKGWKILQESFFMKWENLKVHVLLGCLSGIPVGHGTNKNENLHRQMRIILPRNRLGIDTANALFNSIFYYHNEKKKTVDRNGKAVKIKHVQPIWKFAGKDHQPIGISDMPLNNNVDFDKPFEIESLMDDNLAISEHADHDAYNLTQALPARTRRIINIANQFKQIKSKMDSDLLYRMFGTKGYASIPADIWHPRDFLKKHSIDDSFPLGSILKSLNLSESKKSGTFVEAIGYQLLDLLHYFEMPESYLSFLRSIGITKETGINDIVSKLLTAISEEVNFNCDDYEIDSETEECNFPEALANSLGIMIVLIPACFLECRSYPLPRGKV